MIPDLASLRTGVANELVNRETDDPSKFRVFTDEQVQDVVVSLMFLQKLLEIVFLETADFCDKYQKAVLMSRGMTGPYYRMLPNVELCVFPSSHVPNLLP